MTNDPWAAASAGQAASTTPPASPASSFAGEAIATTRAPSNSSLMGGKEFETFPMLFLAKHAPGTSFKGRFIADPVDVHSTCHPDTRGANGKRLPLYWKDGAPSIEVTDKPVMDLVIKLQTEDRDPEVADDDGRRAWFVSGFKKAPKGHTVGDPVASAAIAVRDAVTLAIQAGVPITSNDSFLNGEDGKDVGKGLYIEVRRISRVEPNSRNSPWIWQARISES